MTRPVRFTSSAMRDVEAAMRWYDQQRLGLGHQFIAEIDRVLTVVDAMPLAGPVVIRDVRRLLLRRYPYALYYRFVGAAIEIRAVLHLRRDVDRLIRRR